MNRIRAARVALPGVARDDEVKTRFGVFLVGKRWSLEVCCTVCMGEVYGEILVVDISRTDVIKNIREIEGHNGS